MRNGSRIFVGCVGVLILVAVFAAAPWLRDRCLSLGLTSAENANLAATQVRLLGGGGGIGLVLIAVFLHRLPLGRTLIRVLANTMLVLGSLLLTLAVIEVALHFRYRDVSVGGFDTPARHTFYPRHYRLNQEGFRDTEHALRKPPDTFRILVLGDSFTFGMGVKCIEDLYPKRLEAMLDSLGGGVSFEVINASKKGWNTTQEYAFFRGIGKRYQPDLVILGYFLNDAENSEVARSHGEKASRRHLLPPPYGQVLYNVSLTYFVFERRLMSVWPALFRLYDDEGPQAGSSAFAASYAGENLAQHTKTMGDLLNFAHRKLDLPFVILLFPSLHEVREDPYPHSFIHTYVEGVARDHDVHLVDLLESVRQSSLESLTASRYDAHPNEAVHEIAARALLELLVQEHLVPLE